MEFRKLRRPNYHPPSTNSKELERQNAEKAEREKLAPYLKTVTSVDFVADRGRGLITKKPITKLSDEEYNLVLGLENDGLATCISSPADMPATLKMTGDYLRVVVTNEAALIEKANAIEESRQTAQALLENVITGNASVQGKIVDTSGPALGNGVGE